MKKHLIRLTVLVLLLFSSSSFAQTINDKSIFEKVFKDVSKDDRPFKNYRYVSFNETLVITFKDGTEKTYNATRLYKAKRTNFDRFTKDEWVTLLNSKSLTEGYFQGVEDDFILLKINDEIIKHPFYLAEYILTATE
ncbi:hypothetical protein H1R17_10625 [Flavobacterium sp. xlx-214]|uniref:hypothetical protein n=1 Tax=unclassified Flavobacterium TaxID=196869 RepID=UPI0013D05447|nr:MULTISPECIES: hypothetical protein [unclassified Flavobacterium]MBA5791670.1 hypothetical protein [Flavobacterium sp. xlx-221]QMI82913.1 hypothetical protein H1R17_10625 [Flavobacterium sp. xlx-214]